MIKSYYVIFLLVIYFSNSLKASIILEGRQADEFVSGSGKVYLNDESNIPSFIIFREESQPIFDRPELWLNQTFGLSKEFSLNLISKETDKLGCTHYRYIQTYNGIVLDGTMWIIHVKNNKVLSMNGWLLDQIKAETVPVLTEQNALVKALQFVKADIYKWQLPEEESLLKKIRNDQSATFFPKGILIYSYDSRSKEKRMYKLSFQFDIYADKPLSRKYITVDAITGEITDVKDRIREANTNATAVTGYSGTQTIVTDNVNATTFRLRENGRGAGLGMETYNLQNGTNYGSAVDFTDDDNYWNNVNINKDQYATDAHLATEKTYDYYFTRYGRNSIDNAGLKLYSYIHFSSNYVNAFWDGIRMTYGDGSGSITPLTSLDIGGHEITHGLTEYTANLNYAFESGALNESFSDCFGTAVEWYADPAHGDWQIGEDIGNAFRSHSNPNLYGDPDTYQGLYWYTGSNDNGGVHTNSGVQNYWFYLLSQGGSGTNDFGNGFSVNGIGIDKAAAIAFRCLTVYLTSTSQYIDARNYSIQAAIDLFGNCSPEMFATIDAWYAVGVGGSSNIPTTIANLSPTTICIGETVTLYATAPFGSTYQWYKNAALIPGAISSQFGATSGGDYYVISNTCGTIYTSNTITVDVISLNPTINPSGSITACNNTLLNANNSNGYNVQWNRNGVPINGATALTYNATLSGNYSFTLSANVFPEQTFINSSVLSIPDNTCNPSAISIISVSGMPNSIYTSGISITINVSHSWDGDLHMMLEAPNGDILGLSRQEGSSGDNFVNTVFSDNGVGPLSSGTAPFTGVFKPWPITFTSCTNTTKTSFASIGNGTIDPNGDWKFHVYDQGPADFGTIDNWSISFPPTSQPSPNCGPVTSPSTSVSIGTKAAIIVNPSPIYNYQLTQKNNFSGSQRSFGSAVTINGKGYFGLGEINYKNDWWEYNTTTDTWSQKSNCPVALSGGTSFAIGSKAYIVGGYNGTYLNTVYEWNSISNSWLLKNNFPGGARAYLSSCVIGGKGYIVGGKNNTSTFRDIWEYDPVLDQWNFKTNISLSTLGRMGMISFELANKMYFGLGQSCNSPCVSPAYSNEWFEYDPQNNTVTTKNNFPGNARENGSSFAMGDKGYLLFGNSGSTFYNDYWEYDVLQDSWVQKGNFSGSGESAASATVINNVAFIFGGITASGNTQRVLEFKVLSNVCTNSPASVSLQASSGTSYLWNTGATTQSITGIPSGNYSVVVNNSGCSSGANINLGIYSVPVASVVASGPLTFCYGSSVNLTAGSATSYYWNTGATTNSISVNTSGNYFVTVTGAGGCTNTSSPVSISAYPGPPVSVVSNSSLSICQGSNVTLNTYGYQSIPFAPIAGSGTLVTLSDDQLSGLLPIGFSFTFFNNTYTSFIISSNGFITFGSISSGCCTGQVLPDATAPNNLIAFAWNDLYPPAGGTIEYFTTGSAPNRKLIVKFNAIPHWPGGNPVTSQLVLFETSNLIEIHTSTMPTNGTAHTMGIENSNGTQAVLYPSRNGTSWTATNDAVRFGTGISSYLWNTGPTTQSIVTSSAGNYSVTVTDGNNCTAASLPVVVSVNPQPNATITANGPTTLCLGDSVTLSANASSSYLWNTGAVTQSIKIFSAGNYSVTVSDANGCTKTSAVTSVTVSPCSAPVNLKVYIQGFYKGGGIMQAVIDKLGRPGICDSITLELHEIVMPHSLAYSVKNVIDVNGNGTFVFPLSALSNTYYLVVKHRNSIETWSSLPITLTAPSVSYNFTNSAAQSFGSNEANLGGGLFGIYSGDINQDKSINATDFNQNKSDAGIFLTGYVNSDLTGDWFVESADLSLLENNVHLAVVILRP